MKQIYNSKILSGRTFILLSALFLFGSLPASAQNIEVKGVVYEESTGTPLPGAAIVQSGTNNAVISAGDGSFLIRTPADASLEVSFLGYMTTTVEINNQTNIRIGLQESATTLDQVVAIGYGRARKRDLTGAVGSVRLEDSPISNLPNINFMDMVKGSIPGLAIGVSNTAGGDPSYNIRGQNSITASNSPLIIMDGVTFPGSMNEINPNDIASVDVLKDASAAAIYGSRAANGVIILTTKRGKTDKPVVNLRATAGIQNFTRKPNMLSPEGFLKLKRDVRELNGATGSDLDLENLLTTYEYDAYLQGSIIDWYDEVTHAAFFQDYNVSISGSTGKTNYYASGNFNNQPGVVVNDKYKKTSMLAKIDSQITNWFRAGLSLNAVHRNFDGVSPDIRRATLLAPYSFRNVRIEGFEDVMEKYPQGHTTTHNPLWDTQKDDHDRNQNYYGLITARIDAPWIKGLSYSLNYGINVWNKQKNVFTHEQWYMDTMKEEDLLDQTKYLLDANGSRNTVHRTNWTLNQIFNYSASFGNHNIDITAAGEREQTKRSETTFSARDFSELGSSVLGYNGLGRSNPEYQSGGTSYSENAMVGYLARLNYNYANKYYASFSMRRDGSSVMGEGNKFQDFYGGAVAWTPSEEGFMSGITDVLNFLKLRASYGQNGNPAISSYSSFARMGTGNYIFGNSTVTALYPSNFANKRLKWEVTTALNVGVDFGVYNDRLSGSINLYKSVTKDLLMNRAIPSMNGFAAVMDNIGKVGNKGIEIQLVSQNFRKRDFQWSTMVNFSLNRNRIKQLFEDGEDNITSGWFIGKPLGAYYTFVFDGIIQETDTEYMERFGGNPGDIKFKNLNDDDEITAEGDRTIVGYSQPNFTVNISNTFQYKNFSLYFMLHWIAGGGKNNYYMGSNTFAYNPNSFQAGTNNWLDKEYWTPDNPSNKIPRPNYGNPYRYSFPKRRDFLRLQDISLSYDFDKKHLEKMHMSGLRVFVSAKNLFTITRWQGLDPEYGNGLQYADGMPVIRTVTFGVDITF